MQLAKHVKFREEKFGGVLFETQSEKVYTLNAAAAAVIREIKPGCDSAQIAAKLQQDFQDPTGKLEQDVHALIVSLQQKGLLTDDAQ